MLQSDPCGDVNAWARIVENALTALITIATTYATLRARQANKDVNAAFAELRRMKGEKAEGNEDREAR